MAGPEVPPVLVPDPLELEPELPMPPVLPLDEPLLEADDVAVLPGPVALEVLAPELPVLPPTEVLVLEPLVDELDVLEPPSDPPALPAPALALVEPRSGAAEKQPATPTTAASASAALEFMGPPGKRHSGLRCREGPVYREVRDDVASRSSAGVILLDDRQIGPGAPGPARRRSKNASPKIPSTPTPKSTSPAVKCGLA